MFDFEGGVVGSTILLMTISFTVAIRQFESVKLVRILPIITKCQHPYFEDGLCEITCSCRVCAQTQELLRSDFIVDVSKTTTTTNDYRTNWM